MNDNVKLYPMGTFQEKRKLVDVVNEMLMNRYSKGPVSKELVRAEYKRLWHKKPIGHPYYGAVQIAESLVKDL